MLIPSLYACGFSKAFFAEGHYSLHEFLKECISLLETLGYTAGTAYTLLHEGRRPEKEGVFFAQTYCHDDPLRFDWFVFSEFPTRQEGDLIVHNTPITCWFLCPKAVEGLYKKHGLPQIPYFYTWP